MGELIDGQPLFPGESEIDQLYIIQRVLGPLIPMQMEMFLRNPRFLGLKFPDMSRPETLQRKYIGKLNKRAMSFMRGLLQMDPKDRLCGHKCLDNSYFDGLAEEFKEIYAPLQDKLPSARFERPDSTYSLTNSSYAGRSESRSRAGRRNRGKSSAADPNPPPRRTERGGMRGGMRGGSHSIIHSSVIQL